MNTSDKSAKSSISSDIVSTENAAQQSDLFSDIERRAQNLSLDGSKHPFAWHNEVDGLLSGDDIEKIRTELHALSVDDYVARVLDPAESANRPSAKVTLSKFKGKIHTEFDLGPLYSVDMTVEFGDSKRRIAFIAQNRSVSNGVWSPEHHLEACRLVEEYASLSIPIVTLMDTPGADAGTEANKDNQAHTISRLIAVMAAAKVPSIGIIYGLGYSGGAIPLATTNLLLAVRNGVFNTIQPKGLANIARQYNLSWQESARYVGVSPSELYKSGAIDGVIDWDPSDQDADPENLLTAILSGLKHIEEDAKREVLENPIVAANYLELVTTEKLHKHDFDALQRATNFHVLGGISDYPSVYGHSLMYLRSLALRIRIHSTSVEAYGRLAEEEIPKGDLEQRTKQIREASFQRWLADPEKLVYNDQLAKAWSNLKTRQDELETERNRITALILGDPQKNYTDARKKFCFQVCLYLYNRWKSDATFNFVELNKLVQAQGENEGSFAIDETDITLLDTLYEPSIREALRRQFRNMLAFDALYNNIVTNFGDIAEESKAFQSISEETLQKILDNSLEKVASSIGTSMDDVSSDSAVDGDIKIEFGKWIAYFVKYDSRGEFLKDVEEWKRVNFPRLSETLLVLITYFFETLVPRYIDSQMNAKPYNGQINPGRIGKRKDFWNQLNIAHQDLLVQRVLTSYKRQKLTTVDAFTTTLFQNFEETNANLMTSNPVSFPGFRQSIEKALANDITPCGVVTGIGNIKLDEEGNSTKVGVIISNVAFQAGAFDMAGAEKLCALLVECARQGLPIVGFISSGGMQTKEGPSSLFSMAIVNDRITHFIAETGLPVVLFGFGDCTGGSQASFVTHPLVHTYYFSGADIPFAGRVVVPSFLPSMATTANYLVKNPGSMQGLVKHPFADGLDAKLIEVDHSIETPVDTIGDVVTRVISGAAEMEKSDKPEKVHRAIDLMKPMEKVLIHARGCTAVKLIRIAQAQEISVLLVQSDPDMDSAACDMLTDRDEVVCLGGQTSAESYLNALSVVTIAKNRGADALHPGIGFLSENAGFARLCRANGLNFIGPRASSMDTMGNKSNAINTAMANNVPVVPGSHGILTSPEATAKVADEIGYPVLLKAVHGGGGKGIKIVHNASETREAFNTVYSEARAAFGNGDLYLEKFVQSMRHIEVQILRDSKGTTQVIGLRDCTVQRNNQKVLEESGSTMLPKKLEQQAYECAANLANAVDYFGAGTVEFIYDLKSDAIYFMEMNTRLQVEHPVTEWTSEVPIVGTQFKIAEGGTIGDLKIKSNGFSIEARITAEKARLDSDGAIDFLPTPGLVTECIFPADKHIEVIAAVSEGKTISPFYDSMIAQLIVHGKNRKDAIKKLLKALDDTSIKGVCTNISLLKRILNDQTFVKGVYDTGYLPAFLDTLDKDAVVEEMAYTGVAKDESDISSLLIPGTDEIKVVSPMTGIYYSTPSPSEPEFVTVGDRVSLSSTLCQIEAMKLFTHISLSSVAGSGEIFTAEQDYEVVRLNQANGAQVNSGDLLFVVKPLKK